MKLKELIKQLNKLPKNLEVFMADGDHGTFETSGKVFTCELIDKGNMDEYDNDENSGLSDAFKYTPKKYIVIRG